MSDIQLETARLYYEERGSGTPILLIHGSASDADTWGLAVDRLAEVGRVITYDRRGFTRSERPDPHLRATPADHADDAAALLEQLDAWPAVVIGRSFGGDVALYLALNHPQQVRAIVQLEGCSDSLAHALAPATVELLEDLADQVRAAVDEDGPSAAGEALLSAILDETDFQALPEEAKTRLAANGRAIAAEMECFRQAPLDPARLHDLDCPVLVVGATTSPPPLQTFSRVLASEIPDARLVIVEGGHMITPTDPEVMRFIREVITSG